jgi:hypothetical protein
MLLVMGILPVQAESLANPLYANGDLMWAKNFGGVGEDSGNNIFVDSNGNVYLTGYFEGTIDFDPGSGTFNLTDAGGGDIFISKLDSNGNFLWAKSMGGSTEDSAFGIAVDLSGNIYTTGYFTGTADFDPGVGVANLTTAGGGDAFVSKLDSNGNFVWAKNMGGNSFEAGSSIAIDGSGNVYTVGFFQVVADFDPGAGTFILTPVGGTDLFISKLDNSGNFVWAIDIGGTNNDFGNDIAVDSSGNIYTTGNFQVTVDFDPGAGIANLTSAGLRDIFVSKLDGSGNFVWTKSVGGTGLDTGNGIALDSGGNVYTVGNFESIVDFDPGMGTANLASAGGSDIFVTKLNNNGDFVWAESMGGTASDSGSTITVDSALNVYTTGAFAATADFDPGVNTAKLISAGLGDIFISKLDGNGNFVWAKSMGGTGVDNGSGIALDLIGSVYTTGYFEGTGDFDPGVGVINLTSAGLDDIFVSKLEGNKNQMIQVAIDIKPGSETNPITTKSKGKIPVAILSTADFDAPLMVDKTSLTFGKTGDETSLAFCNNGTEDVNDDGLQDQVCHFYNQGTGSQVGDIEGILKGQTVEGVPIEGHDNVKILK